MIGDEEWEYADGIATLIGVRIVCPDCNGVIHIGYSASRGYGEAARDHMAKVNGMSESEANRAIDASFAEWRTRSKQGWIVDVAPVLLARYPELADLAGRRGVPGDGAARR